MADDPGYTTVYDVRTGRTWFFRDGKPCEPVPTDDRLLMLLEELRRRGAQGALRRFAIRCARRAADLHGAVGYHKTIDVGERLLSGPMNAEDEALARQVGSAAIAAGAIGLRHGHVNAAAFLSAWACCNEDAFTAAVQAARMAQLAEYLGARDVSDLDPQRAADDEKQRQIDDLCESFDWGTGRQDAQ